MIEFSKLTLNEMEKLYKKKRLAAIILILLVLIPIFIYAQKAQMQQREERLGTSDWRVVLQQSIIDSQNRLQSSGIPEEWRSQLTIMIDQQQYYLDHDINPNSPGAPTFVREFLKGQSYKVYGFLDKNGNQYYERGVDMVAFTDELFNPTQLPEVSIWEDTLGVQLADAQVVLYLFKEKALTRQNFSEMTRPLKNKIVMKFNAPLPDYFEKILKRVKK